MTAMGNSLVLHDFTTLPVEVQLDILGYLSAEDLTRTARVCRVLRVCSSDEGLWRRLCQDKGLVAPSETFLQKYRDYFFKTKKIERGDYPNHIWAKCEANVLSLQVFNGHLYSGSNDKTIRKWDDMGSCIQNLTGSQGYISWLTVFNGHLYSGSDDKTICKWDDTGNCIQILTGHQDEVCSLTVFNGHLYSGSDDKTIRKWDDTGTCIQVLTGHEGWVLSLTVFKGHLYSGSFDKTIRKWDDMGNCIQVLTGHEGWVLSLTVFNGYLYSGSDDKTIRIWA